MTGEIILEEIAAYNSSLIKTQFCCQDPLATISVFVAAGLVRVQGAGRTLPLFNTRSSVSVIETIELGTIRRRLGQFEARVSKACIVTQADG